MNVCTVMSKVAALITVVGSFFLQLSRLTLTSRSYTPRLKKSPPPSHRPYELQDILDKLMHFLPQLLNFVPLKNGFYSFRAQTD